MFRKECYYRAKKHFREGLILPELLSDNLSDVLETFFSENDDYVRETKIVPRERNTVKVKEALR
jgi:hypothetical protein